MDPALQMLHAYDLHHVVDTLAVSIDKTWKLEHIRQRAVALIAGFTCHKAHGIVSQDMTVQRVINITFHCMVTAIHLMPPHEAQRHAVRILGKMQLLTSNLDTERTAAIERQTAKREAELRQAALQEGKKKQEWVSKLKESVMRAQWSDAVWLERQAKLFEEKRKRTQEEAAAAQTLAGMDFPWWPPEEPW